MQDGAAISGDEASEWLRDHFANEPEPRIGITWTVTDPQPAKLARMVEILFGPQPDSDAA